MSCGFVTSAVKASGLRPVSFASFATASSTEACWLLFTMTVAPSFRNRRAVA